MRTWTEETEVCLDGGEGLHEYGARLTGQVSSNGYCMRSDDTVLRSFLLRSDESSQV